MKKAGVVILIIGFLFTVFTGLNFVTTEKVVDIGKLEINAQKNRTIEWSPVIGTVMMAIGAGFYLLSKRRSMTV